MCGIVGVRRFDGVPVDPSLIRKMTENVKHRGPDSEGFWIDKSVGFGHRRLSIIDPEGSAQPLVKDDGVISFNGEIFNYRELRHDLIKTGIPFFSNGDTEVLLSLFLQEGPESLRKLDGQFSCAIYDQRERKLWLFRDHLGILPLYYYWDEKVFIFASEIKALLPALPSCPDIDEKSVRDYLAHRSVPCPYTLFKGIRKFPPGHYLCLTGDGKLSTHQYWRIPSSSPLNEIEESEAVDLVFNQLEKAVKSRLVADVPVGAYLSGGVDSSLIVALMSRITNGYPIETYSAGFNDPRFDELPYAQQVSRLFHTKHHEVIVQPHDFHEMWHTLTWHRDAPVSEPADIAVFKLACKARENVKVLLSGEGSDELFAGYTKYKYARLAEIADFIPHALRQPLFKNIERVLPPQLRKVRSMVRSMAAQKGADRSRSWFSPFTDYERKVLFPGEEHLGHRTIWNNSEGDAVQRMLYLDCHTWLVDNLLERGDRMSMAASIEMRPPFLDSQLVELAFRMPSKFKVRKGCTKWIIKYIARTILPKEIVYRNKVGFSVPLDVWFRGKLRDFTNDLLFSENSFVAGAMNKKYLRELVESHEKGRRDESIRIWTILSLEVWHRVFYADG